MYELASMRAFAGVDLASEAAPDETTVCKFRHLPGRNGLGTKLFREVGRYLQSCGMKVSPSTIVDATIINAPSSTKNASGERDPEPPQRARQHPAARVASWVGTKFIVVVHSWLLLHTFLS